MAEYIDREAAELYICRNFCEFINSIHCHPDDCDLIKDFDSTLDAADVVPVVHAYWIWLGYNWRCSACKRQSPMAANYCPFCGAKMDDVSEDGRWVRCK